MDWVCPNLNVVFLLISFCHLISNSWWARKGYTHWLSLIPTDNEIQASGL